MTGRIYHIGFPKTGTTSIQKLAQDRDSFLGVRQPWLRTKQQTVFDELTNFLLGFADAPHGPRHFPGA